MASNFNDFFGIEDDEVYTEEPVRANNPNKYSYDTAGDKRWGSFAIIALALIAVAFGVVTGKIAIGKSGIQMAGDKFYTGYTYSQLQITEFKVNNKNAKDVSKNTIWTLNNNMINSGSNSTYLDMEYMQWGDNLLTASNGEDQVTYVINLQKSQSDTDEFHNMLSMMVKYPEDFYNRGIEYRECSQMELDELARYIYNADVHSDGSITTIQKYNDINP